MLSILTKEAEKAKKSRVRTILAVFFSESSFNDGTAHNGTRPPPFRGAGSHHLNRLVYGGLGLTLSEKAEGLEESGWLLVGIGAIIIKELGVSL